MNQYAWGKIGEDSEVALLTQSNDPDFVLKKNEPYAEVCDSQKQKTKTYNPFILQGFST